jgi:hypothetical protein
VSETAAVTDASVSARQRDRGSGRRADLLAGSWRSSASTCRVSTSLSAASHTSIRGAAGCCSSRCSPSGRSGRLLPWPPTPPLRVGRASRPAARSGGRRPAHLPGPHPRDRQREVSASGLAKAARRRREELTSRAAATSLGRASSDHHGGPSQIGILSLRPTRR